MVMTCSQCFGKALRLYRFGDRFVCRRCEHSLGMAELNKGDDDD